MVGKRGAEWVEQNTRFCRLVLCDSQYRARQILWEGFRRGLPRRNPSHGRTNGDDAAPLQSSVFELTVQTVFSAAHAIVINSVREPVHGHDWHVTVTVRGESLDADGLLVDFHEVEGRLNDLVRPFRNANLNETAPFDRVNPSAENVAKYLGTAMQAAIGGGGVDEAGGGAAGGAAGAGRAGSRGGARVSSVRVTEAPGCAVTFFLDK